MSEQNNKETLTNEPDSLVRYGMSSLGALYLFSAGIHFASGNYPKMAADFVIAVGAGCTAIGNEQSSSVEAHKLQSIGTAMMSAGLAGDGALSDDLIISVLDYVASASSLMASVCQLSLYKDSKIQENEAKSVPLAPPQDRKSVV